MEHDNQPSSRCLTCWALAVTLEKADIDGWKTTTTQRQMLGSRFCESEDEAVGSFLRECLTQNQGFKAGQVLALRINWPNDLALAQQGLGRSVDGLNPLRIAGGVVNNSF